MLDLIFFPASGEAILGTLKYFPELFPKIFRSRVLKGFSRERAWQENRLGFRGPNLRKRRKKKEKKKDKKDCTKKMHFLLLNFFRASGEAILGTQRYFSKPYSQRSLDQGFQKDLGASEPNEENIPEVKMPNPGKRRFKKER